MLLGTLVATKGARELVFGVCGQNASVFDFTHEDFISTTSDGQSLCIALEACADLQNIQKWQKVVVEPCNATDPRQKWKLETHGQWQALQFQHGVGTSWCVQPDGQRPWLNVPAGVWPCEEGSWPEAVTVNEGKMQWNMSAGGGGSLCLHTASLSLPLPTQDQLRWQAMEIGGFFQYNLGLYGEKHDNYACGVRVEPAASFAPAGKIDTDAWIRSIKQFGARYAILTTQAGCGFLLWPSNSTTPDGRRYSYTVRESPYQFDLVKQFVDSCHKYDVRPALYYIVQQNRYCGVKAGMMDNTSKASLPCGTSLAAYGKLVLQQLTELWTDYGQVAELWFDGGFIHAQVVVRVSNKK